MEALHLYRKAFSVYMTSHPVDLSYVSKEQSYQFDNYLFHQNQFSCFCVKP